jgi:hypothetical protein
MDLVSDTPEFSETGNTVLELALKFFNICLVKLLFVVQHLSLAVRLP